jgi:pimeloyl-ACP methyl ester carboxylesterase
VAIGTQQLVLELPYLDFAPEARLPVLLFLHGVGEGFADVQVGHPPRIGHTNLLHHGPPRLLADPGALAADHPLRTRFRVVSPQLPDRATPWGEPAVVAAVARLLDRLAAEKVYIIGFSKGGRGAFELASALPSGRIDALITIDAAPLDDSAEAVFAASLRPWLDAGHPTWLHYTDALPGVIALHRLVAAHQFATATQRLSHHPPPARVEPHAWLCDHVCRDPATYHWLLAH